MSSTEGLKPAKKRKLSFEESVVPEAPSIPAVRTVITIEPYFDPEIKYMGYEKYGMSGFPGGSEKHDLGYMEVGLGLRRYLTGLDPHSKTLMKVDNEDERNAIIENIEATLDWLEARGYDREMMNPTNDAFWGRQQLQLFNNSRRDLDMTNPEDVILYWNIKGGGYDFVAQGLDQARKSNDVKGFKWYLSELEATSAAKIEKKRIRGGAISALDNIYNSRPKLLFYIAKNVLNVDNYFKHSTPIDLIYDKLWDHIEGVHLSNNKIKAASDFIEAAHMDEAELKLRAIVRDAIFFRFLQKRSDNLFYTESGTAVGKNETEILTNFKFPQYQIDIDTIEDKVTKKWQA